MAGTLLDSKGECLAGADVTATDTVSGTVTTVTKSNIFGDFWLEGLDVKKNYDITIKSADKVRTISVTLDTDADLGDVML